MKKLDTVKVGTKQEITNTYTIRGNMFHYSSKTTIFFVTLLSSSFLSAASPAELGRECAQTTMTGLIQLIKYDYNGALQSQARVRNCIEQAVNLKGQIGRLAFIEAGLATLRSINLTSASFVDGAFLYNLDPHERAYASLCKHFGIEVFKCVSRQLMYECPIEYVSWGLTSAQGHKTLFSGLPFESEQGTYAAFARAATLAYCDAYNSDSLPGSVDETIKQVTDQLIQYRGGIGYGSHLPLVTRLAMDLMYGFFGDRVAEFVCGAHLFAPLLDEGEVS